MGYYLNIVKKLPKEIKANYVQGGSLVGDKVEVYVDNWLVLSDVKNYYLKFEI